MSKYDPVNPYSTSSVLKRQEEKNRTNPHGSVLVNHNRVKNQAHFIEKDGLGSSHERLAFSFTNLLVGGSEQTQDSAKNKKDEIGRHKFKNASPVRQQLDSELISQENPSKGTNPENFPLNKQEASNSIAKNELETISGGTSSAFVLDTSYMGKVAVNVEKFDSKLKLFLTLTTHVDAKGIRVLSGLLKTQLKGALGQDVEVQIVNA